MAHVSFSPSTPLGDALVILGAAGIVIPVFARFRITPVIGFILVGLLVGPYGLGRHVAEAPWLAYVTITDAQALAPYAEFGIILLLFSVGLELSFDRLWAMRKQVLGLGAAELLVAALVLGIGLKMMGQSAVGSVGLGFALSMSSTALVLPIAGSTTPVGRAALAMLLFEDLALVPIIFLLGAGPACGRRRLGRTGANAGLWRAGRRHSDGLWPLFSAPPVCAGGADQKPRTLPVGQLAGRHRGVPCNRRRRPFAHRWRADRGPADRRNRISHRGRGYHRALQGAGSGIFLITVGMSIDLAAVAKNWVAILAATAGVVVVKAVVTGGILRLTGARRGVATEAGILMASPSETTLIVLATASSAA
jgi:CPA2 family monovalent cation:H+ antiporter-2